MSAPARYATAGGDTVEIDGTVDCFAKYGFRVGSRVRFMKSRDNGREAVIAGVGTDGLLWFAMVPAGVPPGAAVPAGLPVQTVSCRCAAELIRQYGWVVIDESEGS